MEVPEWVIGPLCWCVLLCMLGWLALVQPLVEGTPWSEPHPSSTWEY